MMRARFSTGAALLAAGVLCVPPAQATNGYLLHGYGERAKGMAGAGIALAQDALAPATNPAGLVEVGTRLDAGLEWMSPRRGGRIHGNRLLPGSVLLTGSGAATGASADGDYDGDAKTNFFLPSLAYARELRSGLSAGISLYANGGFSAEYRDNPYAVFGSTGTASVSLDQVMVAPAIAARLGYGQSLGLALNLVYQRLRVTGLDALAASGFPGPYSESPGHVTDQGYDNSVGAGLRLGWTGQVWPWLTLGATWQPRIHMSRFSRYRGLLADQGALDVPENYGAGLMLRPLAPLRIAADVQHIGYGEIATLGNGFERLLAGRLMGSGDGPGFGVNSITVYKLGAAWQLTPALEIRAGYSTSTPMAQESQTFSNIMAPAAIHRHLTAGLSWGLAEGYEVSAYYMHATRGAVYGRNSIPANDPLQPLPPHSLGGGEADVHLMENAVGVAVGRRF